MKICKGRLTGVRTVTFLLFLFFFPASDFVFCSTLQGFVYNKQRVPLPEVDVELLNDNYHSLRHVRTDSSGRYIFEGLGDGKYFVKARPLRYDLEEQEWPVELQIAGFYTQDFYLSPRRGSLEASEIGVIFAQEVPTVAKQTYEKALDEFKNKRPDEATGLLRNALTIFPAYYLAMVRLGRQLFDARKFDEAERHFLRAVEVNPKSAVSYYYIGYCYSQHNNDPQNIRAALDALAIASRLAPASAEVALLIGKIERKNGNFPAAEKYLVKAKKLSKQGNPDIQRELVQLYGNDLKEFGKAADELEIYIKAGGLSVEESRNASEVVKKLREKARSQSRN